MVKGLNIKKTDRIGEEIRGMRKKPVKIALAAAVMAFMLVLTVLAWDGNSKRLTICLGLSILSGILLLLPRLPGRISVPLLVLYLCYIPAKTFQRMELPMQDMSRIVDGAAQLTIVFIICVYLLIFLFTQSSAAALGAGSGFFLGLFLVEYYLWEFRGDFLMPSDLKAAGTAISVMKNYQYGLSPEALYSVIYFLFFIVLGLQIRIRMHKWVHVGVSAAAVLLIGGWYYAVMDTESPFGKEMVVNYWNMGDTRNINGGCMSYFVLLKDSKTDVPKNYSEKALREIAMEAMAGYNPAREAEQKPDIIVIMNEAWSDIGVLGELEVTQEYMPFADSLEENTLKGQMYVSILGGNTANTEFEALTGNSLSLLSPAVIPYQNQVQHDMPSLARVLKDQGYGTMAMHPAGEGAWNRRNVYEYLGFDEFIHQGNWEVPHEYVNGFISDACNYKEIIHRYENRDRERPFFLFDVTIQNHGAYYGGVPMDIDVTSVGGIQSEEVGYLYDAQTYLNLIKMSDDAFRDLISYFQQVEEPVIICMFGDHQPVLSDGFYRAVFAESELSEQEQNLQKYIVPYVIWANYEADWKTYEEMSANYLPAALMECAGLQLPPFYQYLMELHEEYPVLTQKGCLDSRGKLVDIADIWESDPIYRYRMFQYAQLYVEDYQRELFEEAGLSAQ